MACREHIWTNSSSDRRSNVSHVNQHIRREVCNICTNNRWVCQVEGCSHVSIPSLKLTTSSNIAQHLSRKHGILYTEEKPIAKSQQTLLTSSSSSSSSSLLLSSANVARSTGTDVVVRESTDERKSLILRFLIKNSLAFNVVDDDTWRGLAFGKFRTWSSTFRNLFY